jgi:cytochrome P450
VAPPEPRQPVQVVEPVQPVDLASPAFLADPWPVYRALRAAEPVHRMARARSFLVLRHADVSRALADRRLVTDFPMRTSRRLFGPTMMDADGAQHRRMRQAFTPLLGSRAVSALRGDLLVPAVREVLGAVEGRAEVDFAAQVAVPLPYLVMTRLIGLPPSDAAWLRPRVVPLAEAIDFPSGPLETARAAKAELTEYLADVLARPDDADRPTLLRLLAPREGGPADAEALSTTVLFLLAGTETSVSVIGTVMHTLLEQGVGMAALEDPEFRRAAVRETLRWEPPTHSILRYAATDLEIRGVHIPRYAQVLLSLASGNRDEEAFADPDVWRPERTESKSLAFGAGPHTCLGIHLALAEFDVLLEELARKFADIRRVGAAAPMTGHGFRRPERLSLSWKTKSTQKGGGTP